MPQFFSELPTCYFGVALADPKLDHTDRALVRHGVVELDKVCWNLCATRFTALGLAQREAALLTLETTPSGRRWLSEMLALLLEALLGDPSHGGNPNGIGWKWLGITPGFPRPPIR